MAVDVRLRTAVYHVIAPTRGKCVPTDFLAGARPKVWLSDRLPAQCTHAEAHQFCLAHLIRDAQYAIDHGDTIFAPQFKAFLKDACAVGRRRPDLVDSTIATHRRRLDRELDRLLNLKPTDVEGSTLRATIAVTARDKLLVFLTRRDVEATNNESERALRPSVIFRRVTNGFRSEWGAKVYADLCSVVATGRLAGRTALAVIGDASRSTRARANRRPIRWIGVSNYEILVPHAVAEIALPPASKLVSPSMPRCSNSLCQPRIVSSFNKNAAATS